MKLTKAIEFYPEIEKSLRLNKWIEHADAIKLVSEAINYIIRLRACSIEHRNNKLPSEIDIPDLAPSADRKQRLRESSLGKEPKG